MTQFLKQRQRHPRTRARLTVCVAGAPITRSPVDSNETLTPRGVAARYRASALEMAKVSINLFIENLVLLPRSFRRVNRNKRDTRARLIAYRASSEFLRFPRCRLSQIENNCRPVALFLRQLRMSVTSSLQSEAACTKRIGAWLVCLTLMGKGTYECCAAWQCEHKWWNRELTLKCKLKCYVKPMKDPLSVCPSKGNQGTTRGKEKILLTSVGIEPTTSGLDLPLQHSYVPLR